MATDCVTDSMKAAMAVFVILCLRRPLNRHFRSYRNCMDASSDNEALRTRRCVCLLSISLAAPSVRPRFSDFHVPCDRPLPSILCERQNQIWNSIKKMMVSRDWPHLLSILFTFSLSSFLLLLLSQLFQMLLLLILLDPLLFLLHNTNQWGI